MVIREERQDKGDRVSRWNACYNITGNSVFIDVLKCEVTRLSKLEL